METSNPTGFLEKQISLSSVGQNYVGQTRLFAAVVSRKNGTTGPDKDSGRAKAIATQLLLFKHFSRIIVIQCMQHSATREALLSEAGFEKVFRTQNWVRQSKQFCG